MSKPMMTTEEYIEKARKRHGDEFDYSKTVYSGSFETVTIICPEHGEFTTAAATHINSRKGSGCSECARNVRRTGAEEFFRRCREVHGDRFDYSQTEFKAQ